MVCRSRGGGTRANERRRGRSWLRSGLHIWERGDNGVQEAVPVPSGAEQTGHRVAGDDQVLAVDNPHVLVPVCRRPPHAQARGHGGRIEARSGGREGARQSEGWGVGGRAPRLIRTHTNSRTAVSLAGTPTPTPLLVASPAPPSNHRCRARIRAYRKPFMDM